MPVRAFEYVGGGSEKFWQVDRDEHTVTVRFGRLGTSGQTQVKQFDTATAAAAQVDKLVSEKVRRGYTEVGHPAAATDKPAAADALPDEDTFVVPGSWRRSMLPRRGDGSRPPVLNPDAPAQQRQLLEPLREDISKTLAELSDDDPELATAGLAYLAAALGEAESAAVVPLGAAVVATLAVRLNRLVQEPTLRSVADSWVARYGVVFAAGTAAELAGLTPWSDGILRLRRLPAGDHSGTAAHPFADRVREHLAAGTDEEYAAARDALAGYRDDLLRQRIMTAFLLPTETGWVDEDCRAVAATGGRIGPLATTLLHSVGTVAQLDLINGQLITWSVIYSAGPILTMTAAVGPAAAPFLARWFDDGHGSADALKRVLAVLATLPTDEAFQLLLDRADRKYVQPALLDAMRRYPVRALRLLAAAGPAGAALLRAHVRANPDVVRAASPQLSDAVRQRVEAAADTADAVPEAPADTVPPVLAEPPWTVRRTAAGQARLDGLASADRPAIDWQPGEREAWASPPPWNYDDWKGERTWLEIGESFRTRRLPRFQEAWVVATAPDEVAGPLLAGWRPADAWCLESWMKVIVARHGLAALPAVLHFVKANPAHADLLLPYTGPAVAEAMADWLARTKSARPVAQAWLARHPAAAGRALVPAALGKPGPARRAAEAALRVVAGAGHESGVLAAARGYGPAAAAGIEALLRTDPLDVLPARIPALPAWFDAALLPQVLLRDRRHAVPVRMVGHLVTMLAMSRPGEVYAGVAVVRDACDPASLAGFAWELFECWRAVGSPARDGWALSALGWIGDDATVRRLAPLIRAWPGEGGHARAVAGLDVLAGIGTDVALMHLHGIAQKVKFAALKQRARDKMAEVAEELGLTSDELADRLVPDLGLDADGSLTLDYGPRRFVVGFDEQLKPYVADADGTRRKDLPKPGARDDAELAGGAYQRFAALKKDVRTIATDQIRRLEEAMVLQRRWPVAQFRELFVGHPLLWHIVRRLVWASYDGDKLVTAFRVAEDRSLANVDDDALALDDTATVGIAHPLHLGEAVPAWSEVFADYEILQPFAQLGRETYPLTDEERAATELLRFTNRTALTVKVLGLDRRGWRRGEAQDGGVQGWLERPLPGNRAAVLSIEPGIPAGMATEWPEQRIEGVWVNNQPSGDWRSKGLVPLGELDPVLASELVRDIASVVS